MAKSTSKKKPAAKPAAPTAENVTEQPAAVAGAGEAGQAPGDAPGADIVPAAGPDPAAATPPAQDAPPAPGTPGEGTGEAQGDGEQGGSPSANPHPATPTVDTVLEAVARKAPAGAVITRPDTHLSGPQAELQNRIYCVLLDQGVTLRSQGDVYGWLLGQILDAMPK